MPSVLTKASAAFNCCAFWVCATNDSVNICIVKISDSVKIYIEIYVPLVFLLGTRAFTFVLPLRHSGVARAGRPLVCLPSL